jgi:hypothetical protein
MSKPIEDRVREGIALLKKLQEVGIGVTEPGYKELQTKISDWVRSGDPWSGKIEFTRYGRIGDVLLPRKATAVASMALKIAPGIQFDN